MRDSEADRLLAAARDGDARSLARLISVVERGGAANTSAANTGAANTGAANTAADVRPVMRAAAPHTGNARVIGLTGSPGVGKSTVTDQLVRAYRTQGHRVAVLAVDPTSPFTGGALLGDRVRMSAHATDAGVYIRSMASRGHLGGLSQAAPAALRVLDAAGFGVVCVETVGVGQAEVEIAGLADSTLVVMAPGLGDSVQTAKAGILEIADLFVVNKSDRPGAHEVVRDLRTMLAMANYEGSWKPPIVSASATTGEGITELVGKLDAHWEWLGNSGVRTERRVARARIEVSAIAVEQIRRRIGGAPERRLDELAAQVAGGKLDPYSAADELLA